MRTAMLRILAAGSVACAVALSAAPSFAKTVAECNAEYAANKDAIKAAKQTKKDFVAACRAGTETIPPAGAAATPAPTPTPAAATAPAAGKTAAVCNAEFAANIDAIKAAKETKKDFVAACRAGTETIPPAVAAPAAPPPAATATPAPAPTPTPAAIAPKPAPATVPRATGAGGFATDTQAKAHCPGDTVVWVNTHSGIYHFAGTHNYGTTKQGTYMCEADAKAAGDRAAENERHP